MAGKAAVSGRLAVASGCSVPHLCAHAARPPQTPDRPLGGPPLSVAGGHGSNGPWGWVPAVGAAALFAWFATMIGPVAGGGALRWGVDWLPALGIRFAFVADGLSLTFALLISGIGALVLLYSNSYLAGHPHWWRFAGYLFAFMLSMLGLVLADDLIALFVFWELTTITSYLLIGFDHASPKSRRSALQALFVTGAGALALLAGLILLGLVAGTTSIGEINAPGAADRRRPDVSADPDPDPPRRVHQVGAGAVPLLAAQRDGRADAGERVPPLGDDGQGRRVPDGPPPSRPFGQRRVVLDADACSAASPPSSPASWRCARRTSSRCWPTPP